MYIHELVCVSVLEDRLEVDKMYLPQMNFTLLLDLNLNSLTRLTSKLQRYNWRSTSFCSHSTEVKDICLSHPDCVADTFSTKLFPQLLIKFFNELVRSLV